MSSSSRKARRRTRKESRETRAQRIVIIPRRYGVDAKTSIVFQRFGILSRYRLPGNPAVCYRPRIGDDGMMTSKISRIIALVILLFGGPALAQPDARRGLSLARENCEQCHAIDNTSESSLAAAPPFRELHLKYAVADLQRPLTQGPHTKFRFEPSQIEALMAYLKTLGR
jgi:cytochrome c